MKWRCQYLFAFLYLFFIVVFQTIFFSESFAQWMLQPLPAPKPDENNCCGYFVNKSDIFPPKVFIDSNKLVEGVNILKLKIVDDSPLKIKELTYSKGDKNITTYLAKTHTGEYRALLKVLSPSTVVKVNVMDSNGNSATFVKNFTVANNNNPLLSIFKFIQYNLWESVFVGVKH